MFAKLIFIQTCKANSFIGENAEALRAQVLCLSWRVRKGQGQVVA